MSSMLAFDDDLGLRRVVEVLAARDAVAHLVDRRPVLLGDAEQLADHVERELHGEVRDDVELRRVTEAVEELARGRG